MGVRAPEMENTIFIDIDGTLTDKSSAGGNPIQSRVDYVKKLVADGKVITIWSATGLKYAQEFVAKCGITGVTVLGKPGYFVDDALPLRATGNMEIVLPGKFFAA